MSNMRATRTTHSSLGVCVQYLFVYLVCLTCCPGFLSARTMTRCRRSHQSARYKGLHHRPLTDEQRADQNLQFMLSLYRSAAEPDGRPKQHRKFGSNTVRLLRPSASSVHYLPSSREHHYSFTVQYNIDTLPSEQLIRASFIHLRSQSSPSSAPPRCMAQITSLGKQSVVTLEPHQRWTETDITAHIIQHGKNQSMVDRGRHLALTTHYRCTEPGHTQEDHGLPPWYYLRIRRKRRRRRETLLEVPSLLLYLEEEREVKDWMGDLLGLAGDDILQQRQSLWHPLSLRLRRSKDKEDAPEPKDLSLDVLKNVPTSTSSFSTSPSATIAIPVHHSTRKNLAVPKNRCKLHSFRLSFDELGWGHYFIAPPVYNPRFCQGNCPRVLHYGYHSPNHAIIQTVINDLGVGDVPPPSCVPYKYMPMSVLVVHKKKVEYRELEDMVAESCTCR